MRRSTASATSTARNNPSAQTDVLRRPHKSRLTLRILGVNLIAPLVLVYGFMYMGTYRDNLIRAELETMSLQAQLFSGAIAESALKPVERGRPFLFARPEEIESLMPEMARRIVRRMGEASNNRTRLFDDGGYLIGDSQQLAGPGGVVQVTVLPPPEKGRFTPAHIIASISNNLLRIMPIKNTLPQYPYSTALTIEEYPDAKTAMGGQVSASAWNGRDGNIILTAAAPVQKSRQTHGVVMISRQGTTIEKAMMELRFGVMTVFLLASSVTIFLSLYLAGVIGRPLKRLARAAHDIRTAKNRQTTIPDLSHRQDEIGDLSIALRDMTQALWDRMDTIDRFAADVAHEIKNPLTSLRSAVETVARVTNPDDRAKLMDIIQHDVSRLDRLISDISNASRLDAELSRDEMGEVDLRQLLENLASIYREQQEREHADDGKAINPIILEIPQRKDVSVRGNEGRLAQVFENLIGNALSFSPAAQPLIVRVIPEKRSITITVEDEGPGIPNNKLETIFERFYSERPKHESYGNHSGLGLSIARQIVTAHNGQIFAENRRDKDGKVTGAIFTVILKNA